MKMKAKNKIEIIIRRKRASVKKELRLNREELSLLAARVRWRIKK